MRRRMTFHSRKRYARSRASSRLVRSRPAVLTMKPRPLGGFSSSMMSRSLRRWPSSTILRETPTRLSPGMSTRYRPGMLI